MHTPSRRRLVEARASVPRWMHFAPSSPGLPQAGRYRHLPHALHRQRHAVFGHQLLLLQRRSEAAVARVRKTDHLRTDLIAQPTIAGTTPATRHQFLRACVSESTQQALQLTLTDSQPLCRRHSTQLA
jgi:hypothetical protein